MPEPSPEPTSHASLASAASPSGWAVTTALGRAEALAAFKTRARRGKLAEFRAGSFGAHGGDFSVEAAATPFDYRLVGEFREASEGSLIDLRLVRLRRMPVLFAAVLAVTIWPGVWLTDSMLVTYFGWYSRWTQAMPWFTYAWYLPLTAGPLPWMWRGFVRKSRAEALASGAEMAEAVAQAVDGSVETN